MDGNTDQLQGDRGAMDNSLSRYFQRSAAIVSQYADLIEQDYAQPVLRHLSLKFKENPITMTFLSVFAGLSVLPLLSFIGFTVFTFSSVVFVAFVSAAIVFIAVELVLVGFLVSMLCSLFVVACFITTTAVLVYFVTRLGVLVTYEGRSGVSDWALETRQHFSYKKEREVTEDSDESAVLVDRDGPNSKKVKVEEEETRSSE